MKEVYHETVTETKEKEVGYKTTCNKCGKENNIKHDNTHLWEDDMKEINLSFGYESKFDGEHWDFHLCEECMLTIIREFKFAPEGFMDDGSCLINSEEHQKVFENWKETDEWDELKFKTYEELVLLNDGWVNVQYLNEAIKKYHPDKPSLDDID